MQVKSNVPSLILASKSPRRQYLLEQAGIAVEGIPSRFDETRIQFTEPDIYVKEQAEAKAAEVSRLHPNRWVIGADTVVSIDGSILGKPQSRAEARTMLTRLSGKTHQVFTGYCICRYANHEAYSDSVKTDVEFKNLTHKEIEWYVSTKEPFDKAGAYAIQGLGTFLVKRINGSYTNVVGLPVCEVVEHLIQKQIIGVQRHTINPDRN